jgi:hypothetical protein
VPEEEKDIYELCLEINDVVFDRILVSRKPALIAKTTEYLFEQGLRTKVAFETHANKSIKDQKAIDARLDSSFKEQQESLWRTLTELAVKHLNSQEG